MDCWKEPSQMQVKLSTSRRHGAVFWLTLYKDIDREGEIVGVSAVTDVIIENHKVPIQIFGNSDLIYTFPETNSKLIPEK